MTQKIPSINSRWRTKLGPQELTFYVRAVVDDRVILRYYQTADKKRRWIYEMVSIDRFYVEFDKIK